MPGDYGLFFVFMFSNRFWPVRAPADDGWVTGTDKPCPPPPSGADESNAWWLGKKFYSQVMVIGFV